MISLLVSDFQRSVWSVPSISVAVLALMYNEKSIGRLSFNIMYIHKSYVSIYVFGMEIEKYVSSMNASLNALDFVHEERWTHCRNLRFCYFKEGKWRTMQLSLILSAIALLFSCTFVRFIPFFVFCFLVKVTKNKKISCPVCLFSV